MKKVFLLLILSTACIVQAQRKPKIKGNKNVIEVSENLPSFNAIELIDDLDIVIQKAPSEGYQLMADDNLVDVLKFRVVEGTLVISSFYKITGKKKLNITINYNELNSITLHDGSIKMEDKVESDELIVHTTGKSKLQLNASASVMNIVMDNNTAGDFHLEVDSLNMTLKERVDLSIYVTSETSIINMQDNASIKMDGTATNMQVNMKGNCDLKAQELIANIVNANLEDSAKAKVHAKEILELSSSGSSKTYLSGDAKIEIHQFLDTSELYKVK